MHREATLPEYLKIRTQRLVEVGAIESVGHGRGTHYILSRALYSALGQRGVHTRKRGLDDNTNKALILEHLKRCSNIGAGLMEIRQINPALSEDKMQRLLKEMREDMHIAMRGQRRWARYFIHSAL